MAEAHKIEKMLKHVRGAGENVVRGLDKQNLGQKHVTNTRTRLHIEDVRVSGVGRPQNERPWGSLCEICIGVLAGEVRVAEPWLRLDNKVASVAGRGVVVKLFLRLVMRKQTKKKMPPPFLKAWKVDCES